MLKTKKFYSCFTGKPMKIKCLTDIKTQFQYFHKGSRVTVSDSLGREWASAGWAEDLSGAIKTKAPEMNSTLTIASAVIGSSSNLGA